VSGTLVLRSQQRACAVDLRSLRRIVRALLTDLLQEEHFNLGICLVSAPEMARLNETYLQHRGPTDVITFDYTQRAGQASGLYFEPASTVATLDRLDGCSPLLHGEIFVCLDEAIAQARRFRTSWQSELVRYIVHGLLHLQGQQDLHAAARRRMKREENRLLRQLGRRFNFRELARQERGSVERTLSRSTLPRSTLQQPLFLEQTGVAS